MANKNIFEGSCIEVIMKISYLINLVILSCFIICTHTGCVRDQYPALSVTEDNLSEKEIRSIINIIQGQITQNITNQNDIDFGFNIEKIENAMVSYKPKAGNSIIKINEKPYDLLIVNDLLIAYDNIMDFWVKHRHEKITTLAATAIDRMTNGEHDDHALADAIFYFSSQSEMADFFFQYLFEQFQLRDDQYSLDEMHELTITIIPLPITAVNIDDIPFDSVAVNALQSIIDAKLLSLTETLENDLLAEVNVQFDIFINNVDSYLDWYYRARTEYARLGATIFGAINPNKTAAEAAQEYMLRNYIERIGRGSSLERIINTLENKRDAKMDLAFILVSLLEDCSLEFYHVTKTVQDITSDQFMASFIQVVDYLDILVFEGVPLLLGMGDGDMLDADDILALEVATTVGGVALGFIPVVGDILDIGLEFARVRVRENLTREEFKTQIISAIQSSRESVIRMIRIEGEGEEQ